MSDTLTGVIISVGSVLTRVTLSAAPSEELFINYDYADPSSKGITNERPLDVLMNKGHVPLLEMQSRGDIGLIHEPSDAESNSSETSEEDVSEKDEV